MAIVTCEGENVDPDNATLFTALEVAGLDAQLVVWDDKNVDWDSFDVNVIRSTWNYSPRRAEFLRWAQSVPRLVNPYPVLEYSSDKLIRPGFCREQFVSKRPGSLTRSSHSSELRTRPAARSRVTREFVGC